MSKLIKKDVILIVGGFSSGRFISPLFKGLGFRCIHICSKKNQMHPMYKLFFNRQDYDDEYIIDDKFTINELKRQFDLNNLNVLAVIPGIEPCVGLADLLAEKFDTPRNELSLSEARRNKFYMHKTLRKTGIRSADQILTRSLSDIYSFLHKHNKIVIKPVSSAFTDNVFYCTSQEEAEFAFNRIIDTENYIGDLNEFVLVQEYIKGKQFIVNTMSFEAKHFVTDIWEEVRLTDDKPSDDIYADFMSNKDPRFKILKNYVFKVLTALGINIGPAHAEVRLDEQEAACLIEIGARLPGSVDFSILNKALGFSQLSLLPECYLRRNVDVEHLRHTNQPAPHIRFYYMYSNYEGLIRNQPDYNIFTDNSSVQSIFIRLNEDGLLQKTNRSLGIARPGYMYLVNENKEQLDKDYQLVKANEHKFYESML